MDNKYKRITANIMIMDTGHWSASISIKFSGSVERFNAEFEKEEEARTWLRERVTTFL